MSEEFFKFPSTPHLALLEKTIVRDDKVLSERERDDFLKNIITVEEKIDGANLGISFDRDLDIKTQNRGSYIHKPYFGQWKKLSEWILQRRDLLFDVLTDQFILFGEWCYAEHSIHYDQLPDWFIGFDIFDKKERGFLSCKRRDMLFRNMGISGAPFLMQGSFEIEFLKDYLATSNFCKNPAEGIYIRVDEGDWLRQRAKLVRPEFIQDIEEHWSRKGIKPNRLRGEIRVEVHPDI